MDAGPPPPVRDAADGSDDAGRRGRWSGRMVPVLVVVAVVVALVAAWLAVTGLVDDDRGGRDAGRASVTAVETPSTAEGGDDPGGTTPETERPDVEVDFEGEGALPAPGDLGPWAPGRGAWFLSDGAAVVSPPGSDEAVTYFNAGTPDLEAEVTLPEASPGAGLAFRLSDDANYLAWTIAPDGRGLQVVRVDGAVQTVLLGPDDIDAEVDPDVVLGVRTAGPDIELMVDGEVVGTTIDDGPQDRVGVGLVAIGTDEVSMFDDLRVTFG